jgi:hypothetical protein
MADWNRWTAFGNKQHLLACLATLLDPACSPLNSSRTLLANKRAEDVRTYHAHHSLIRVCAGELEPLLLITLQRTSLGTSPYKL